MVPVSALEATANAFVGHRFALFRTRQISGDYPTIPSWLSIRRKLSFGLCRRAS